MEKQARQVLLELPPGLLVGHVDELPVDEVTQSPGDKSRVGVTRRR